MRNPLAVALIASLFVLQGMTLPAFAKIRIYGGPVQSAGSGRYYPPGNFVSSLWVGGQYPGYPGPYRREETRIDLNPLFVPGTVFAPPGYVPAYFPRSYYFANDYIGYYSERSMVP